MEKLRNFVYVGGRGALLLWWEGGWIPSTGKSWLVSGWNYLYSNAYSKISGGDWIGLEIYFIDLVEVILFSSRSTAQQMHCLSFRSTMGTVRISSQASRWSYYPRQGKIVGDSSIFAIRNRWWIRNRLCPPDDLEDWSFLPTNIRESPGSWSPPSRIDCSRLSTISNDRYKSCIQLVFFWTWEGRSPWRTTSVRTWTGNIPHGMV